MGYHTTTNIYQHGGNLSVTTSNEYTPFADVKCRVLTVVNHTDVPILVRQNSINFIVFEKSYYDFFGISNASDLSIKMLDDSNRSISARWLD